MRILAIDASPRLGVVSSSVELAAQSAETTGAQVTRVRLADLDIRYCTGCKLCGITGACKIADDLPSLAEKIAEADGVIIGTNGYFKRPDHHTQALLDRLAGYFPDPRQMHLPGLGTRDIPQSRTARAAKRAVIITACAAPEPLATFFGYNTGPIRELRGALGSSGYRTIGSLSVTDTWLHPGMHEWEQDRARSLGRVLGGKI
jgi:hypothetical protein